MKNLDTKLSNEKKIIEQAEKIINQANSNKNKSKNTNDAKKISSPIQNTDKKQKDKNKSLPKPKRKSKKLLIIIPIILIIFAIIILSFIFGLLTSKSTKIISGISINGVDISNLTKEEAIEKLELQLSQNLSNELILSRNDYSTTFNVSTIEPSFNLEESVNIAYNIGRSENNIFANNAKVISTYFNNSNIIPSINYNSELLTSEIERINNELPDKVVNSSYKIEDDTLIIYNSSSGYKIQTDLLSNYIENSILNNITNITLPVEEFVADSVDIEAIYNEVHKEAIDAYYTTDPYEIHKEEEGLDFAITLDEAKALVNQNQESYSIKLKVIKPKVTVKSLPQEAFPDLLATYSTNYSSSSANRSTNIALATKSINGIVLMPGETFSYNGAVGQRTAARGYKEAGVYLNGEVTTGLGGGICQVSSTLYNSVLLSNLEIVERTNHTFKPSYVPSGQDATVSWGAPDFKFKNNRDYPIKIVATTSNKNIITNIYGLKTDNDYEVKIVSSQVGVVEYKTEYQNDSSIPAGTQKVKQSGSNGCKTQTYKILYKNGTEVSRTLINSDTYKPHNQIILVGTGASQNTPNKSSSSNRPNSSNSNPSSDNSSDSPSFEISY